MQVKIATNPNEFQGNALLIGIQKTVPVRQQFPELNPENVSQIESAIQHQLFDPEQNQSFVIPLFHSKNQYLIACGLGEPDKITPENYRKAAASGTSAAKIRCLQSIGLFFPSIQQENEVQALLEGTLLATYAAPDYRRDKTERSQKTKITQVTLFSPRKNLQPLISRTQAVIDSVFKVRDLVNLPSAEKTPVQFAAIAKKEAQKAGLKIKILTEKELSKLGMGGILGVSAGSHEPARLVVLEYKPARPTKTVALVGKGVTFDSGGLNLKPWEGMLTMKQDMAGAATVMGILIAVSRLKLPVHLLGFCPLVENMPANHAVKDGDILTTHNKKTIEVIHTDAEGRIILADALAYAESFKPDYLIDLATLTGAQTVALGRYFIGTMGNNPALLQEIIAAGNETMERCWELPLVDDLTWMIQSETADVRNIGKVRGEAGTILGGAFLKQFVEKTPWVHLDIASTAFLEQSETNRPYLPTTGATGTGVRLLIEWLKQMSRH